MRVLRIGDGRMKIWGGFVQQLWKTIIVVVKEERIL